MARASSVESEGLRVLWGNGTEVETVDWGTLSPGASRSISVEVVNEEDYPVTVEVDTTNWDPLEASTCISLTLNPRGVIIEPDSSRELELVLYSSEDCDFVDFSFDTVLTGVECRGISGFVPRFKTNPYTKVVYPSDEEGKAYDRVPAMVSDWTASAFVSTKLDSYIEGLDTEEGFIERLQGESTAKVDYNLITFGGPIVNVVVYYYESQGIAPVAHGSVPGAAGEGEPWSQWYLANGSSITESAMEFDEHNDLFLVEVFTDRRGREVFICYGVTWKGTYAAGKYFDSVIYPELESIQEHWMIVKWHDNNGDGFVNGPDSGDQYTVLASSSDYR